MFRKLLVLLFLSSVSAEGNDYTAFVVEDTVSMVNDLDVVKQWITDCMAGKKVEAFCESTVQFILATFSAPTTGKVFGPTSSGTISAELKSIKPHGSGSCSEALHEGVERALSVIPSGISIGRCNILVFSEGTPSNTQKVLGAYTAAARKGCRTIVILSGCCGKCPLGCSNPNDIYCVDRMSDKSDDLEESRTTEVSTTPVRIDPPKATDRYVAFVVDDTGSMKNEIEAVKFWIESCVEGSKKRSGSSPCNGVNKFVLQTYNDPTVGKPLGPTDGTGILNGLKKIKPRGGGDCLEKLFGGVLAALNAIPARPKSSSVYNYCRIFIFTDATAKDESKALAAFQAAILKGCAMEPLLTGCCGKCPAPCTSISTEYCQNKGVITDKTAGGSGRKKRSLDATATGTKLLLSLAELTGGKTFVIEKPTTPQQMLAFLKKNIL